ncbi:MAG TPA: hypothetical protein VFB66_19475 [Tepidisphaeraceae bacterium]|nr:hypothetical protein [Tepidisphaeraceae bacterium]
MARPTRGRTALRAADCAAATQRFGVRDCVGVEGYVLAVGVTAAAMASVPWSGRDGDRIAAVALPLCVVGGAFGIVGVVRPSRHRTAGVLGLLVNVATGVAVALLWLVTHVPV